MNPTPYAYAPWQVNNRVSYDNTTTPSVYCSDNVGYWQALCLRQYPPTTNPDFAPQRRWYPTADAPVYGWCNLKNVGNAGSVRDFYYTGVPRGILTEIVLSVCLDDPLVPGDFNSAQSFFSTTVTPIGSPFAVGYTEGSTNSALFKDAQANGAIRSNVYDEMKRAPQNFPLIWFGLDDLIALTKLEVMSVWKPNDTYQFTLNLRDRGIFLENGDRLRYYHGAMYMGKVRSVYLKYGISKRREREDVPYVKAGSKATV